MRWILLIGALGLLATQASELRTRVEDGLTTTEDPDGRAAVEIECRDTPAALRDDCALELRREFESGLREPRAIVQRHCTRYPSAWPSAPQPPPAVCTEIFGGWIES